jgi:enterochelin esterase-like enzyme
MSSILGLTSAPLAWLLTGAAAASIGVTVRLWPRLSRQGAAQITGRLGLIIVSQLLVASAVLTAINDSLYFYGSWIALLGNGSSQQGALPPLRAGTTAIARPVVITGSSFGTTFRGGWVLPENYVGGARSQPDIAEASQLSAQAQPTPQAGRELRAAARSGAVLRVTIRGQYSGIVARDNYVYLPPQYFQPAYAATRFPVVLAFAGYPGNPLDLIKSLQLPAIVARLQAAGRIGPAIYLMVNPSVALPRDTECTNVPAGLQVATFFGMDVPLAVDRTFRTVDRSAWGTIGYSTGATCAVKMAMLYPAQYRAAVGMSGYYYAVNDASTGNLYGGSNAYQNENDMEWRLKHLPAPPVSVLLTSSSSGERNLPGTLRFLRLIRPPMRGYSLILRRGGHNYYTWRRALPQSLLWLSNRIARAVAAPPARQRLSSARQVRPTDRPPPRRP